MLLKYYFRHLTACLSPEMVQEENMTKPITRDITPSNMFLIKFSVASLRSSV